MRPRIILPFIVLGPALLAACSEENSDPLRADEPTVQTAPVDADPTQQTGTGGETESTEGGAEKRTP
jgi:hypothetical protein